MGSSSQFVRRFHTGLLWSPWHLSQGKRARHFGHGYKRGDCRPRLPRQAGNQQCWSRCSNRQGSALFTAHLVPVDTSHFYNVDTMSFATVVADSRNSSTSDSQGRKHWRHSFWALQTRLSRLRHHTCIKPFAVHNKSVRLVIFLISSTMECIDLLCSPFDKREDDGSKNKVTCSVSVLY